MLAVSLKRTNSTNVDGALQKYVGKAHGADQAKALNAQTTAVNTVRQTLQNGLKQAQAETGAFASTAALSSLRLSSDREWHVDTCHCAILSKLVHHTSTTTAASLSHPPT
jgi:hypothetical protein